MVYRVVKGRRAWWPVFWNAAAEDGGHVVENKIELRFKVLGADDAAPLIERASSLEGQTGALPSEIFATLVEEMAEDWRSVGGENGELWPWNRDNLQALMGVVGVFDAVMRAYRSCLAGVPETRLGN